MLFAADPVTGKRGDPVQRIDLDRYALAFSYDHRIRVLRGELRNSSRGIVAGLATPAPLVQRLPGVLQDDEFTQRFVGAFDEAYAPILATLDSLACYFDPRLAPADFVDYLAGWVGVQLDDSWDLEQRRAIVAGAALVHRSRGTDPRDHGGAEPGARRRGDGHRTPAAAPGRRPRAGPPRGGARSGGGSDRGRRP